MKRNRDKCSFLDPLRFIECKLGIGLMSAKTKITSTSSNQNDCGDGEDGDGDDEEVRTEGSELKFSMPEIAGNDIINDDAAADMDNEATDELGDLINLISLNQTGSSSPSSPWMESPMKANNNNNNNKAAITNISSRAARWGSNSSIMFAARMHVCDDPSQSPQRTISDMDHQALSHRNRLLCHRCDSLSTDLLTVISSINIQQPNCPGSNDNQQPSSLLSVADNPNDNPDTVDNTDDNDDHQTTSCLSDQTTSTTTTANSRLIAAAINNARAQRHQQILKHHNPPGLNHRLFFGVDLPVSSKNNNSSQPGDKQLLDAAGACLDACRSAQSALFEPQQQHDLQHRFQRSLSESIGNDSSNMISGLKLACQIRTPPEPDSMMDGMLRMLHELERAEGVRGWQNLSDFTKNTVPRNADAVCGESMMFAVFVNVVDFRDLDVHWYKFGKPLIEVIPAERYRISVDRSRGHYTLVLYGVQVMDSGLYICALVRGSKTLTMAGCRLRVQERETSREMRTGNTCNWIGFQEALNTDQSERLTIQCDIHNLTLTNVSSTSATFISDTSETISDMLQFGTWTSLISQATNTTVPACNFAIPPNSLISTESTTTLSARNISDRNTTSEKYVCCSDSTFTAGTMTLTISKTSQPPTSPPPRNPPSGDSEKSPPTCDLLRILSHTGDTTNDIAWNMSRLSNLACVRPSPVKHNQQQHQHGLTATKSESVDGEKRNCGLSSYNRILKVSKMTQNPEVVAASAAVPVSYSESSVADVNRKSTTQVHHQNSSQEEDYSQSNSRSDVDQQHSPEFQHEAINRHETSMPIKSDHMGDTEGICPAQRECSATQVCSDNENDDDMVHSISVGYDDRSCSSLNFETNDLCRMSSLDTLTTVSVPNTLLRATSQSPPLPHFELSSSLLGMFDGAGSVDEAPTDHNQQHRWSRQQSATANRHRSTKHEASDFVRSFPLSPLPANPNGIVTKSVGQTTHPPPPLHTWIQYIERKLFPDASDARATCCDTAKSFAQDTETDDTISRMPSFLEDTAADQRESNSDRRRRTNGADDQLSTDGLTDQTISCSDISSFSDNNNNDDDDDDDEDTVEIPDKGSMNDWVFASATRMNRLPMYSPDCTAPADDNSKQMSRKWNVGKESKLLQSIIGPHSSRY